MKKQRAVNSAKNTSWLNGAKSWLRGDTQAHSEQKSQAFYKQYGHLLQSQTYYQEPGKPVWSKREYTRFADEAYVRNVVAHRCISMIATNAASVAWNLSHDGEFVKEHPAVALLAKPNAGCAGPEFFESLYSYRMISGNAFVLLLRDEAGQPRELHTLRPDRVAVIAGANGLPMGYEYTVGKKVKRYPIDRLSGRSPILHLKHFHPLDDWYGLSPVEAAAYSIDQHNQAAVWNQALLQNGAKPSGAMVVKGSDGGVGTLDDEQFSRLKQQIDEQFSGAMNAGRPLLLEGGLDWKEMSLSPRDMDFIESKHSAARDIALAFGVPPQMLGIPGDNTYNNMAEARLAFWEQTIIPLLEHVICAFNGWLLPHYGKDYRFSYDADSISALAPRREKVWERVRKADFLSDEEKRKIVRAGREV